MKRLLLLFCLSLSLSAREYRVDSSKEIKDALAKAKPGDVISVKAGIYDLGGSFSTGNNGSESKPIHFRCAGEKDYAVLKTNAVVGFRIKSKHWIISGIHVQGSEKKTQATVFMDGPGGCGNVTMTDCKISGSAVHGMKAARTREVGVDNIILDHVELFNTAKTGFDLVSGDNWLLKNCYVHDYGKVKGVSYGIFLKGGGSNGIIDGCFVDGKSSNTTVGISFGGGLTGKQWLPLINGKIAAEHDRGIARNNIVVNTKDVAFHSNNSANCGFYNNLAWNCKYFQRQGSYPADPVLINNLLEGKYRGVSKESNNIKSLEKSWFNNADANDFRLTVKGVNALKGRAVKLKDCSEDMFGTKRSGQYTGPIQPGAKRTTFWIDRRK